ncbi:glycosyltransferase family 1 protein [Vibrio metoecus]|uniref:glycosyltransferase family 1 protein n=1 Tax=Vibrio metoecus TaxID=1481663 RepID=UPI0001B99264|nr:glycosyltransferase family 1 protein [Vibrio metoecus]EEX67078.1 hypothetical protein VCJ_000705 [Vibrio metoecus]
MNLLIISTLNEKSGSCVAINSMITALHERGHTVDLWAPHGDILESKKMIPKGLISSLFFILKNKDDINRYERVVVYTIRGTFIHLFIRGSILYVHEINAKSRFKYRIVNALININKGNLFVVNPEIMKKYPKCKVKTVGNFFDDKGKNFKKDSFSILMISAFSVDKGIDKFKEIAIYYPHLKFVLLTTLLRNNDEEVSLFNDYCASSPKNLNVMTDQSRKTALLEESEFLVSLSLLDESFGLVIFEAIQHGCYPLTFSNTGSRYLLGDYPFLEKDDCVTKFESTLKTVKEKVDINQVHQDFVERFDAEKIVDVFTGDIA